MDCLFVQVVRITDADSIGSADLDLAYLSDILAEFDIVEEYLYIFVGGESTKVGDLYDCIGIHVIDIALLGGLVRTIYVDGTWCSGKGSSKGSAKLSMPCR